MKWTSRIGYLSDEPCCLLPSTALSSRICVATITGSSLASTGVTMTRLLVYCWPQTGESYPIDSRLEPRAASAWDPGHPVAARPRRSPAQREVTYQSWSWVVNLNFTCMNCRVKVLRLGCSQTLEQGTGRSVVVEPPPLFPAVPTRSLPAPGRAPQAAACQDLSQSFGSQPDQARSQSRGRCHADSDAVQLGSGGHTGTVTVMAAVTTGKKVNESLPRPSESVARRRPRCGCLKVIII